MADKTPPKDFLDWLGLSNLPNWAVAKPLGGLVAMILALLFLSGLVAAFALLGRTITGGFETEVGNLGAGALIVALLGAPFLIWNTVIKQKTVEFQKESHITERISKAVEQLGEEKKVDRIGRAITIWTGEADRINYTTKDAERFEGKPRTKVMPKEWTQSWNDETEDVDEGYRSTVATWPEERTIIQWRGDEIGELRTSETIGVEGPWQVFSETAPNIEVRIGGLLSLERIAQDSTIYDKGRDHVRVMKILCAYIRENSPVGGLTPDDDSRKFRTRDDVQMALDVIKSRSEAQISIEKTQRYRLDLKGTDFRGYDLAYGHFQGALLMSGRFENAKMQKSDFSGAIFDRSVLNFVECHGAVFVGASLDHCRIDKLEIAAGDFNIGVNLANLTGASLVGSDIPALSFIAAPSSPTFGTKDTILCEALEMERGQAMELASRIDSAPRGNHIKEVENLRRNIAANPFSKWSQLDSKNLKTGRRRQEFRESLGLVGWPYDDT